MREQNEYVKCFVKLKSRTGTTMVDEASDIWVLQDRQIRGLDPLLRPHIVDLGTQYLLQLRHKLLLAIELPQDLEGLVLAPPLCVKNGAADGSDVLRVVPEFRPHVHDERPLPVHELDEVGVPLSGDWRNRKDDWSCKHHVVLRLVRILELGDSSADDERHDIPLHWQQRFDYARLASDLLNLTQSLICPPENTDEGNHERGVVRDEVKGDGEGDV